MEGESRQALSIPPGRRPRLLLSTAFMEETTGLLVDASVVIDADRVSVLENQLVRASVLLEVQARPVCEEHKVELDEARESLRQSREEHDRDRQKLRDLEHQVLVQQKRQLDLVLLGLCISLATPLVSLQLGGLLNGAFGRALSSVIFGASLLLLATMPTDAKFIQVGVITAAACVIVLLAGFGLGGATSLWRTVDGEIARANAQAALDRSLALSHDFGPSGVLIGVRDV